MKKLLLFFIPVLLIYPLYAQDDYVIEEPKVIVKDKFSDFPNPDYTNYTFSASAFTLKKKHAQALGTDILYAKGSYGLSDNLMGSLNATLFGTFIASIKKRIELTEDLNLAFSGSAGNGAYINEDSTILFAGGQGLVTFGDIQNNITFGIGLYFGKSSYEIVDQTDKLYFHNIFVATHRQLRRKLYLVAEGIYLWNYNSFIGSFSLKFIIQRNGSLHVGLMPLYRNGRIRQNQTRSEGGVIPVVSYRWLFRN